VLDDRAWQDATPLSGFVQAEPFEGRPASQNTEVRILYDDQAIYIGVICHDSDPSQIVKYVRQVDILHWGFGLRA